MCNEALFTPKHATLETVRTLGALLLTVSTSSLTGFAFSNGQHVNQGVQMNTGGKICQITTTRHSANKLAFRASDCVSRPWLDLCQCFKHCRQKLWRHGRCFGSVYMLVHTGQETSSRRLWGNVVISMVRLSFWGDSENFGIWPKTMKSCDFVLFFKAFLEFCYGYLFNCIS